MQLLRILSIINLYSVVWNDIRIMTGGGDLPNEDKRMNDSAIKNNDDRIVVRYNSEYGDIYIITEWDRSYTTILFTHEY